MNDSILGQNLVELLRSGHTHVTPKQALDGVNPTLRNARPADAARAMTSLNERSAYCLSSN
jgi:hypothetical protein